MIGLAVSRDGETWSPLVKIRDAGFAGERQGDHPACGLELHKGDVVFYVQRDVGGIEEHGGTNYEPHLPKESSLGRVTVAGDAFETFVDDLLIWA